MSFETKHIKVGSAMVRFHIYGNPKSDISLLRVHGNEYDASDAGRWAANAFGHCFLDIENDTREIYFDLNQEMYAFDPNRIFSQSGIEATLRAYCDDASPEAVREVESLARFITNRLRHSPLVVALHNNDDFNIRDYLAGGECQNSAKSVYQNPDMHPHDFAIVTHQADYDALKAQQINVVIEHNLNNDHPGSLSEYCLAHGIRYINIETKKGRGKTQRDILKYVLKLPIDSVKCS